MDKTDTGVINIIYTSGDTPTLRGIMDTGPVLNGNVNDVAHSGVLNIPSSTFSSYGTYRILVVLENFLGNLTEEAVIHYEQSISGFQVCFITVLSYKLNCRIPFEIVYIFRNRTQTRKTFKNAVYLTQLFAFLTIEIY